MDNFGKFLDVFELTNTKLPDEKSLFNNESDDHPHSKEIALNNKYFSHVKYHTRKDWEGFIFEVKSYDFEEKFNYYLNVIGANVKLNLQNFIDDFELNVDNFREIYICKDRPKSIDICYKNDQVSADL
jgi:hypothetical protein